MKKILIPTDFSECANNATRIELAKKMISASITESLVKHSDIPAKCKY